MTVLGEKDKAKKYLLQADPYFARLQQRRPTRFEESVLLITYLNDRVMAAELLELEHDATAFYLAAIDFARDLEQSPEPRGRGEELLALSLVNYGGWLVDQERFRDARGMLLEAVERMQRWRAKSDVYEYAWAAANTSLGQAELESEIGLESVKERLDRADKSWQALSVRNRDAPWILEGHGKTWAIKRDRSNY